MKILQKYKEQFQTNTYKSLRASASAKFFLLTSATVAKFTHFWNQISHILSVHKL